MLQMCTLTSMLEFNDYDEMAVWGFHCEMKVMKQSNRWM